MFKNYYFITAVLAIILFAENTNSQTQTIEFFLVSEKYPRDCNSNQYFDIGRMECVSCPDFAFTTNDSNRSLFI